MSFVYSIPNVGTKLKNLRSTASCGLGTHRIGSKAESRHHLYQVIDPRVTLCGQLKCGTADYEHGLVKYGNH